MTGIGSDVIDGIKQWIAASKTPLVLNIAVCKDAGHRLKPHGCLGAEQINAHKAETGLPKFQVAEAGRFYLKIPWRMIVAGTILSYVAHGLPDRLSKTQA